VPWIGLLISCALPAVVLMITSNIKALGELYAIGVVGAIAINLTSCAWNKELPIRRWERYGLWGLGFLMIAVEGTIVIAKPHATIFAGVVLAAVLGSRFVVHQFKPPVELVPVPQEGWLAQLRQAPLKVPTDRPRIMLAARGMENSEFAVERARKRGAVLFGIYVRVLRVLDVRPGLIPKIEDDPPAQEALGHAAHLARDAGVPFFPIYVNATEIGEEILDYTVTFGCEELIMGKSRRSLFARAIEGDVLSRIASHLPEGVSLITRAGGPVMSAPAAAVEVQAGEPPPS
jgi:nucleotide-binding universal stress UspA family protein